MGRFETTKWTIILKARSDRSRVVQEAYAYLCKRYWSPLYTYFRSKGVSVDDAHDLTQELLTRLYERNVLHSVSGAKGRFRTFLLVSANNLLKEQWAKQSAQKRIPPRLIVDMNIAEAERLYRLAALSGSSPERAYDYEWATTILRSAFDRVRREYENSGRGDRFVLLSPYLSVGDERVAYSELAAATGLNVGAIKAAVHRLRERYRKAIHEQIADTVAGEAEFEDELRYFLTLFEDVASAHVVGPDTLGAVTDTRRPSQE